MMEEDRYRVAQISRVPTEFLGGFHAPNRMNATENQ